jgi:hypothetical protein
VFVRGGVDRMGRKEGKKGRREMRRGGKKRRKNKMHWVLKYSKEAEVVIVSRCAVNK